MNKSPRQSPPDAHTSATLRTAAAFYGVLPLLAWVLGGLFAAAAIEFLVGIGIGATLLIEWGYKTEAFALHRKLTPTGTSAMAQTPLLHLEHHRRVAQAQGRRGA